MTREEYALQKLNKGTVTMFTLHRSIMGKFKCASLDAIATTTNLLVSGKVKCFVSEGDTFIENGTMTLDEVQGFMNEVKSLNENRFGV